MGDTQNQVQDDYLDALAADAARFKQAVDHIRTKRLTVVSASDFAGFKWSDSEISDVLERMTALQLIAAAPNASTPRQVVSDGDQLSYTSLLHRQELVSVLSADELFGIFIGVIRQQGKTDIAFFCKHLDIRHEKAKSVMDLLEAEKVLKFVSAGAPYKILLDDNGLKKARENFCSKPGKKTLIMQSNMPGVVKDEYIANMEAEAASLQLAIEYLIREKPETVSANSLEQELKLGEDMASSIMRRLIALEIVAASVDEVAPRKIIKDESELSSIAQNAKERLLRVMTSEERFSLAIGIMREERKASVTLFQRRLHMGYGAAATLVEILEQKNIISPENGGKPREVLVPNDKLEKIRAERQPAPASMRGITAATYSAAVQAVNKTRGTSDVSSESATYFQEILLSVAKMRGAVSAAELMEAKNLRESSAHYYIALLEELQIITYAKDINAIRPVRMGRDELLELAAQMEAVIDELWSKEPGKEIMIPGKPAQDNRANSRSTSLILYGTLDELAMQDLRKFRRLESLTLTISPVIDHTIALIPKTLQHLTLNNGSTLGFSVGSSDLPSVGKLPLKSFTTSISNYHVNAQIINALPESVTELDFAHPVKEFVAINFDRLTNLKTIRITDIALTPATIKQLPKGINQIIIEGSQISVEAIAAIAEIAPKRLLFSTRAGLYMPGVQNSPALQAALLPPEKRNAVEQLRTALAGKTHVELGGGNEPLPPITEQQNIVLQDQDVTHITFKDMPTPEALRKLAGLPNLRSLTFATGELTDQHLQNLPMQLQELHVLAISAALQALQQSRPDLIITPDASTLSNQITQGTASNMPAFNPATGRATPPALPLNTETAPAGAKKTWEIDFTRVSNVSAERILRRLPNTDVTIVTDIGPVKFSLSEDGTKILWDKRALRPRITGTDTRLPALVEELCENDLGLTVVRITDRKEPPTLIVTNAHLIASAKTKIQALQGFDLNEPEMVNLYLRAIDILAEGELGTRLANRLDCSTTMAGIIREHFQEIGLITAQSSIPFDDYREYSLAFIELQKEHQLAAAQAAEQENSTTQGKTMSTPLPTLYWNIHHNPDLGEHKDKLDAILAGLRAEYGQGINIIVNGTPELEEGRMKHEPIALAEFTAMALHDIAGYLAKGDAQIQISEGIFAPITFNSRAQEIAAAQAAAQTQTQKQTVELFGMSFDKDVKTITLDSANINNTALEVITKAVPQFTHLEELIIVSRNVTSVEALRLQNAPATLRNLTLDFFQVTSISEAWTKRLGPVSKINLLNTQVDVNSVLILQKAFSVENVLLTEANIKRLNAEVSRAAQVAAEVQEEAASYAFPSPPDIGQVTGPAAAAHTPSPFEPLRTPAAPPALFDLHDQKYESNATVIEINDDALSDDDLKMIRQQLPRFRQLQEFKLATTNAVNPNLLTVSRGHLLANITVDVPNATRPLNGAFLRSLPITVTELHVVGDTPIDDSFIAERAKIRRRTDHLTLYVVPEKKFNLLSSKFWNNILSERQAGGYFTHYEGGTITILDAKSPLSADRISLYLQNVGFDNVVNLKIRNCTFDDIFEIDVRAAQNLETLSLKKTGITEISEDWLYALPKGLKALNLRDNKLSQESTQMLMKFVAKRPGLTVLVDRAVKKHIDAINKAWENVAESDLFTKKDKKDTGVIKPRGPIRASAKWLVESPLSQALIKNFKEVAENSFDTKEERNPEDSGWKGLLHIVEASIVGFVSTAAKAPGIVFDMTRDKIAEVYAELGDKGKTAARWLTRLAVVSTTLTWGWNKITGSDEGPAESRKATAAELAKAEIEGAAKAATVISTQLSVMYKESDLNTSGTLDTKEEVTTFRTKRAQLNIRTLDQIKEEAMAKAGLSATQREDLLKQLNSEKSNQR